MPKATRFNVDTSSQKKKTIFVKYIHNPINKYNILIGLNITFDC